MNLVQKEFSYSEYYEEQREYTGPVKRANKEKKKAWEIAKGKKDIRHRDSVKKLFELKTLGLEGITEKDLNKSISRFNNKFYGADPYAMKGSSVSRSYYYDNIKNKINESKTLKGKIKTLGKRFVKKLVHK